MKRTLTYLLSLLSIGFSSCVHKDLTYDDTRNREVKVVFDWSSAPTASPASMEAYMYGDDNSTIRYVFDNMEGGEIEIPYGKYCGVCMNADNTDWIVLRNTGDPSAMELATGEVSELTTFRISSRSIPRAEGAEDEKLVSTPGMLWSNREDGIEIKNIDGVQTIVFHPEESVCHYTVDIVNVQGLSNLQGDAIDATLSGMSESYKPSTECGTDSKATMPFILVGEENEYKLHGEFLTFGESSVSSNPHYLTVYAILSDGTKWYHSFDVADQIHSAQDPKHVYIKIEGLTLPKPISGGGSGFKPDVNDWQTEDVDLKM